MFYFFISFVATELIFLNSKVIDFNLLITDLNRLISIETIDHYFISLLVASLTFSSNLLLKRFLNFSRNYQNIIGASFSYIYVLFSVLYLLRINTLSRLFLIIGVLLFVVSVSIINSYTLNMRITNIILIAIGAYLVANTSTLDTEIEVVIEESIEATISIQEELENVKLNYNNFSTTYLGSYDLEEEYTISKFSICCTDYKYFNYGQKTNGYIKVYNENLIYLTGNANIQIFNTSELKNKKQNITTRNVDSNLSEIINNSFIFKAGWESIKDFLIFDDEIYISYIEEIEKDCVNIQILKGEFNFEYIEFEKFFTHDKCILRNAEYFNAHQSGGKLLKVDKDTIAISIGDFRQYELAQNDESLFGKIHLIDLATSNVTTLAKGVRNPQGLSLSNNSDFIISTEHGPKGGDEINIVELNKINNFGWPISSYGDHYGGTLKYSSDLEKLYELAPFHKSHKKYGFREPAYYFPYNKVVSHGISDIEINYFSPNKFLIGTLNGRVLYDVELNLDENKLSTIDTFKIFERIRDLEYDQANDVYFLIFEDTPAIGILEKNN